MRLRFNKIIIFFILLAGLLTVSGLVLRTMVNFNPETYIIVFKDNYTKGTKVEEYMLNYSYKVTTVPKNAVENKKDIIGKYLSQMSLQINTLLIISC
ncbi:hypothetical protein [Natranaerovirga pectinivora]|uniref:hypothetical protein n=1 Tax=Natranaerovirga pectinivora TaxID=682400 RepID=UPI00104F7544|nr:hypothetical protein [Natranaerovirga pectinivora]